MARLFSQLPSRPFSALGLYIPNLHAPRRAQSGVDHSYTMHSSRHWMARLYEIYYELPDLERGRYQNEDKLSLPGSFCTRVHQGRLQFPAVANLTKEIQRANNDQNIFIRSHSNIADGPQMARQLGYERAGDLRLLGDRPHSSNLAYGVYLIYEWTANVGGFRDFPIEETMGNIGISFLIAPLTRGTSGHKPFGL